MGLGDGDGVCGVGVGVGRAAGVPVQAGASSATARKGARRRGTRIVPDGSGRASRPREGSRTSSRFVRFASRVNAGEKEGGTIAPKRAAAVAAGAIALAGVAAFAGWTAGRTGHDRIGVLERRIDVLATNAAAVQAERDRIKADRDRLERQLAAQTESPRACPRDTVSTSDAELLVRFAVDYPCGWNVLEDPLQTLPADSPRKGLMLDELFFSPLPISRAPRGGPLAEITLDSWYDDPNAEGDALPSFDAWLAEAEKRFTKLTRSTVTSRGGTRVTKLEGSMNLFDEPRPAVLYVWEWTDREGGRRISEAFALDPSRTVSRTIDALVRSFRVLGS